MFVVINKNNNVKYCFQTFMVHKIPSKKKNNSKGLILD
jgi:hypothetical protein